MTKREATIRQLTIYNKLRSSPASFDEVYDYLQLVAESFEYNFDISKRTFQRDIQDIQSIYSIDIEFDKYLKKYTIRDLGIADERLLESLDIFNALNAADSLPDMLHFEQRKPIGSSNINDFMHAIRHRKCVTFNYIKFWDAEAMKRTIKPYGLKEFKNRWYVVGEDTDKGVIRIFGLDRVDTLQILNSSFKAPDFNIETYFEHSFGIIRPDHPDDEPMEVVLSATPFKGRYLKSVPLHPTQKIIVDDETETRLSLKVYITHDFKMEILSHGYELKVLEPLQLQNDIREALQKNLDLYDG